jgi:Isopropylmalate/homocitrate/citramalate synthases
MNGTIKVLDCTLRDGGQCLEDLNKNGMKTEQFTEADCKNIALLVQEAKIEIIELGCIEESDINKENFASYCDLNAISAYIPKRKNNHQIFVGLYTGPDADLDRIPPRDSSLCDGIRVILRYSELQKSIDYCRALARKGYLVFVQPMLTMRYSDCELAGLIDAVNDMGAFALYLVDSFGYMDEHDVERLYAFYNKRLEKNIHIGFHAHNNSEMAFCNVKHFLKQFQNRDVIIDSCVSGMGQGAGNMQTEILVNYLNQEYGKDYNLNSILEVCEILEKFKPYEMETWGYSPVRFVPAMHGAAYKYAVAMRQQYHMTLSQINDLFSSMPAEMKHRYTQENLKKLLEIGRYQEIRG